MKKTISIISSISVILFLTALIWLIAGIYIDKKNGDDKADLRYEKLLKATKENFENNVYGTSEFANSFIQAIGNIDDFSSLKLEINGQLVYSYPPTTFNLPTAELVKNYSDTVSLSDKSFTLKASLYLMSPNSIYTHSRFAFILILIGTLITGLVIVFMSNSDKSQEDYPLSSFRKPVFQNQEKNFSEELEKDEKDNLEIIEDKLDAKEPPAEKASTFFNPDSFEGEEKNDKDEELTISFPEESPTPSKKDETEWVDDDIFTSDDSEDNDEGGLDIIDQFEAENRESSQDDFFSKSEFQDDEQNLGEEDKNNEVYDDNDDENTEEANEESDLSPLTQIRLQSSLEAALDSSIEAGKSQATLALVKINNLDRGNAISQKIISILKSKAQEKMLFEYKADAYALIFEDKDLQNTVNLFEDLYSEISDFLKDNNAVNEVSVGISSASDRKIKAERIILEADQALNYASQDPDSPIIAFRANPEKYKEFMDGQ
ncbi:MAG: hypothetical protein K5873_10005 [Treponema sp.]|nr:hypothetical protein [Treponema sp.]